jgi:PAS domain S-box-containing protein
VPGLGLVVGLAALDAHWDQDRIISSTVVIGPFVTALVGSSRQTTVVALAALAACVLSGSWNHNYGAEDYVVRVLTVAVGGVLAIAGARGRARLTADRQRFRLLSSVAAVSETSSSIDETVRRLSGLLVPGFADVCVIDLAQDDGVERLAAATYGPNAADLEAELRNPPPEELGALSSIDARSSITVPLRARGQRIGSMALATTSQSGRRFGDEDRDFAEVLSGRVALALDNAGLFSELETLEAQQAAALGGLAEAITIQDRDGRLVFANAAAAEALGFATPDELLGTPPSQIVDAFESFHEDGTPLQIDRLPGRRALAGETPEPLLIKAINRQTGEERWRLTKAAAVRDRAGRPRLAVNIIEDVTDVKRAEIAQRFLAESGAVLASSLDYEETLVQVARLVVPELADWCGVNIPDDDGYLRSVAVAHVDPAKVEFARDFNDRYASHVDDPTGAAQVLRERTSQLVNDIPDELLERSIPDSEQLVAVRTIGMRSAMIVPMVAAGRAIGTISLVSAESGRNFTRADLELAEELGRRAGTAVENARLYSERSQIARTLQSSLLPAELPAIPGFTLASMYRPAGSENWVGGDFYDAVDTPNGWMVNVGDVSGHGAEAAALTAQARHTLRTAAQLIADPRGAISQLNDALTSADRLSVCTVVSVLLTERAGDCSATVVCAGHPQPLLLRDGVSRPVGRWGPLVGAWQGSDWEPETVELLPGDLLLLYTDGVTDARGAVDRFGEERLRRAVEGARGAQDAVDRIRRALDAFEIGPQADDTAIVAVARNPAPDSPRPEPPG